MKKIRILLISPISEYKSYILPTWLRSINSLYRSYNSSFISLDVLLCDNSQNASFHKRLSREFGIPIIHVDPMFKNSRQFICESRNRLRDYFLRGNYNRLLSLECDLFPEPGFITQLLASRKKVISLPYFIGEGSQSQPMIQMVDADTLFPRDIRNISDQELFCHSGRLIRVFNAGLGCTLISRDIVEDFPFRWDPEIHYHDDSFFGEDLHNAGVPWFCDTSLVCRHLNQPWNYFPTSKF